MNKFTVISYYTIGTGYEQEAERLKFSCQHFSLEYEIIGYPSLGDWLLNVNLKPHFCLEMFNKHHTPIVFVDCDAVIRQYPRLFRYMHVDFAAHWRDGKELLSGTIFFNKTMQAEQLIKKWIKTTEANNVKDQAALAWAFEYAKKNINEFSFENLPASYTQIFDTMAHYGYPVIEHNQASRRLRDNV